MLGNPPLIGFDAGLNGLRGWGFGPGVRAHLWDLRNSRTLVTPPLVISEGIGDRRAWAEIVVRFIALERGHTAPAIPRAHHKVGETWWVCFVVLAAGHPRTFGPGVSRGGGRAASWLISQLCTTGGAHLSLPVVTTTLAVAVVFSWDKWI